MALENMDIDWGYLIEKLESLINLGEEFLSRELSEYELDQTVFSDHHAFRWQRVDHVGYLVEIDHPDIPELGDLLGIERGLERLRRNTLQFVKGHPANNVLLWGERGTGKSSAIKGLLGEFGDIGLRMVEVSKDALYQLPLIAETLRLLPYRFILFCDDLSFDESEAGFRELKTLLEGGLEARPENLLVYATSNRRHLTPERLTENTGENEIHPEEAVSEKLSLSDRFGITIGFYPIGEDGYLDIVCHLCRKRKLHLTKRRLEEEALQWARMRGSLSGRIARQFVDDLTGQLALESRKSRNQQTKAKNR